MKARILLSHRARRVFIFVHLWLGLVLGAWFSLIGVTGSVLTWRTELGAAELSRKYPVQKPAGEARMISLAGATGNLQKAFPDLDLKEVSGITLPGSRSSFYSFTMGRNRRTARSVLLDPYTGKVLGMVAPRTGTVATIQQFHQRLIAGVRGYVVNGFLTALSVPLLLSGIWLWWPSNGKQLRARLTVKREAPLHRKLYDLHNVMGIYLYGALFVTTVTGALLVYNHIARDGWAQTWKEIKEGEAPAGREGGRGERGRGGQRGEGRGAEGQAGVEGRGGRPAEGRGGEGRGGERAGTAGGPGAGGPGGGPQAPTVTPEGEALSNEVLLEKARQAVPQYEITRVQLPRSPEAAFQASYSLPTGFAMNKNLYLNPYTGETLASEEQGANYNSVVRGLHLGDFAGVGMKIIYTLTGLMPLGLFISGVWLWARKKMARSRNKARHQAEAAAA